MRPKRRHLRELEALAFMVFSRVAIAFVPFRRIAGLLGQAGHESSRTISARDASRAVHVRKIIFRACRRARWKPSCLVRSMAAIMLLRRNGLDGTLYLGVNRKQPKLRAHAWVRCGDVIVAGGREHRAFSVLTSFTRATR